MVVILLGKYLCHIMLIRLSYFRSHSVECTYMRQIICGKWQDKNCL